MNTIDTTLTPCAYCGHPQKDHGSKYTRPYGAHLWVDPANVKSKKPKHGTRIVQNNISLR